MSKHIDRGTEDIYTSHIYSLYPAIIPIPSASRWYSLLCFLVCINLYSRFFEPPEVDGPLQGTLKNTTESSTKRSSWSVHQEGLTLMKQQPVSSPVPPSGTPASQWPRDRYRWTRSLTGAASPFSQSQDPAGRIPAAVRPFSTTANS